MATKKKCALCPRTGKTVVARDSNVGGNQVGSRRCVCRHGCGKTKADARKAVS